jgi:uncharacterized integral membrane protein
MLKRAGLVILGILLFVLMMAFTFANRGEIELDFWFAQGSYPISLAVVATFVLGIAFGMLCMAAFAFRLINERRALRRALRLSESEVSSLRNLPLSDAD